MSLRLLYISDLHLRRSNREGIERELEQAVEACSPELVLLGGDLVDDRSSLSNLARFVENCSVSVPVAAVSGNHDFLVGRDLVREAVLQAGGHWLEHSPLCFKNVQILGSVEQLVEGAPSILCSHYPTDFSKARELGVGLTLAGHLHGWQIVLGKWGEYLYPGALLSRWNGLRFERGRSTMLVSRGVTDLFPLRWNCPREVILVETGFTSRTT